MVKIISDTIPNMPWEDRPAGSGKFPGGEVLWRYSKNPIIGRNPTPASARIFNSAVIPYGDGYAGVFRSDHKDITMHVHFGKSANGIDWEINDEEIQWIDERGGTFQPGYAYDPRLVKIGGEYFIMWCTSFDYKPTIGI
jgi:beta-1,4-mannooligosaccharide/beta-1,4-mannosyl-N-acetylglucosamine phosphorylase